MPNRRQIREATIQFLYCSELEGGASAEDLREPFWQFLTEADRRNLLIATFRTLRHIANGRADRLAEFIERAEKTRASLGAVESAENLLIILKRLLTLESSWSMAFTHLERIPKSGDHSDVAEDFENSLKSFFGIDRDLAFNRQQFIAAAADFPSLKAQLEATTATLRRLQRISERIRMVEEPELFPEQTDLAKIRDCKAKIVSLRLQTDQLVDAIMDSKAVIDAEIAALVENYSPERIDPVDRAILRLGSYEILKTDTPRKVVINEAVELAKRFGTQDSHRFVNGILDKFGKSEKA